MNEQGGIRRLGVCMVVYGCAAIGLGLRLAFLHLGPHDDFRASIESRRQIEHEIRVERGTIYDRGGRRNILAMDLSLRDICADPKQIVEAGRVLEVSAVLAELLGRPVDEIAVRLNRPDRRYARLERFAHDDLVAAVAERNLPGLFFRNAYTRYYPHRAFLCHVLGFVNHEGVGGAGLEQALHRHLTGTPGRIESKADALRDELYLQRGLTVPGEPGHDVELTIDQNIQHIVEKTVDWLMEEHQARGVWVIVQKVRTGEILAMASRPGYDLNAFGSSTEDERLNRAIGFVYEPGSTFKIAAFSAALNENLVSPDTLIDCENGLWMYANRPLRDVGRYREISVADGLQKSSNIMTAKLSLMLGDDRFEAYLRAFGIGSTLGIDLPGEERGILHPARAWQRISPTRIAIGQGVSVTALQVLNMYCAIANDGFLMRPYVVREVRGADGTVVLRNEPHVIRSVVRPHTAAVMTRLLARATEPGGTGRRAAIEGMAVAGKTGTAQKPVPGGYSATDYVASFAGFLPADDPELGIIVVLDSPKPEHSGGRVAAPAFRTIADEAVRYMGLGLPAGQLAAGRDSESREGLWP